MRIRKIYILDLLLPICLLGFMGVYLVYINIIFNENGRWGPFALLLLFLMLKNKILRFWDPLLTLIIFFYVGWCFLSSFWSDVLLLSLSKSIMFGVVVVTMVSAGMEWVRAHHWYNALNYIGLLAFVTLLASVLGKVVTETPSSDSITLFQGNFVTGANMLGFYMAASFPLLLWKTYSARATSKKYYIRLFLLFSCLYFLFASMSRGAILATLATTMGFIFSLNLNKKMIVLFFSLFAAANLCIYFPEKAVETVGTYFFKVSYQKDAVQDVFSSRRKLWEQSYDAAMEGGLFGLGYGITAGESDFSFEYGLTSSHYGREKGNSQLAIMEETGVVGLILYSTLLLTILFKIITLYIKVGDKNQRVLVGILGGIFFGMIFQSIFEGWWDAPGGPEFVYFWLLVGIIRGLEITIGRKYAAQKKIPYAQPVAVLSAYE